MKVLFLTNIPAPYRVDFFNELGKLCELTVLFERRSASDRNKDWISKNFTNFRGIFLQGFMVGEDSSFCPSVINWLKKEKFNIFVIGGYSTPTGMLAIELLKLKRIPFILNADGGFIKNENFIIKKIKKYFIGSAAYWLSTGKETSRYLLHYGAQINKIFMYPFTSVSSLDLYSNVANDAEKIKLREMIGIKGDRVVISVGQFINRKGFDVLIKAWEHMPKNITLLVVGGGQNEGELLMLIHKKRLFNVQLTGFKEKKELKKYYRAADLFVLPTREDIWGLVVNEAMACGLPVIATNRCLSALELIDEGENGYIVPVNEEKALVDKINCVIKHENVLNYMAKKSLDRIKPYTIENMAKAIYETFIKLTN